MVYQGNTLIHYGYDELIKGCSLDEYGPLYTGFPHAYGCGFVKTFINIFEATKQALFYCVFEPESRPNTVHTIDFTFFI